MNKNTGCKKLWAPWRMKYIEGMNPSQSGGCLFCEMPGKQDDENTYIVMRAKTCYVIMNIYPYNNGHVMVVPYRHTPNLGYLSAEERLELMDVINLIIETIKSIMRPDGFNIGMNLGRVAGAGVEDHIHMHIVPRWNGDTNFMPIIGNAKVICESLEDTYARLKKALAAGKEKHEIHQSDNG